MAIDPLDFLDGPGEENGKTDDPLDFLDKKKKIPKSARYAGQALIGAGQVAMAPYELAVEPLKHKSAQQVPYREELLSDLEQMQMQKASGNWSPQEQELYDSLLGQIENPKKAEQFIKPVDIGIGALAEKGGEKLGLDLKPEGFDEEIARLAGGFLNPKTLAKQARKLPGLLTKEGRAALSATKQAEKVASKWNALSTAAKGNPEKEGLLSWAQKKDLSPEATTLLMQSNGRADVLGKIAKKTKKFKGTVTELHEKLGKNYDELKAIGRKGGYLGSKQTETLSNDLRKMIGNMERTLIEGPDTKAARTVLESGLNKLEMEGATVEDLINGRLNLSQSINWKNVDPKGAMLKQGREAFMKGIEKVNPKVAKELRKTDVGWDKYRRFAKHLDKQQATMKIKGIEIPAKDIVFATALKYGLGASVPGLIKVYAAKEVVQRLSTALISNPKFQSIHKQLMRASLDGAKKNQAALLINLKKMIQEDDPDLYSELDFSE